MHIHSHSRSKMLTIMFDSRRSPICRCVITSEWNVEGGRLHVMAGFFGRFFSGWNVGLTDGDYVPRVM